MRKSIGILGGMGPMATADLFAKIIANTKASTDSEHVRIYIDNNPSIPDRTAAILGDGADPVPCMTDSLRKLEACGSDCIIVPCNTAHYFVPQLQKLTNVPFVSILEATASACAKDYSGKTAAILATKGTLSTGLYEKALAALQIKYLIPDASMQDALMRVIYQGVKADSDPETYRADMECVLNGLIKRGADYFILACTELPLAFSNLGLTHITVDPTLELAKAAIRFCGYDLK